MSANTHICSVCHQNNFDDCEYVFPVKMCNSCFAKYHSEMMNIVKDIQQSVQSLLKKRVEHKQIERSQYQDKNFIAPEDTDSMHIYKFKAWDDGNLIWEVKQDDNINDEYSWNEARQYVRKLNMEKYAGFDNWRLPTIDELEELVGDEENNGFYIKEPLSDNIDQNTWFWTSSRNGGNTAWFDGVDFTDGAVNSFDPSCYKLCVRCVRSKK